MIFKIGPENNEKTIEKNEKNQKNKRKNHTHTPSKVRFLVENKTRKDHRNISRAFSCNWKFNIEGGFDCAILKDTIHGD